jgi:hypothetical protein
MPLHSMPSNAPRTTLSGIPQEKTPSTALILQFRCSSAKFKNKKSSFHSDCAVCMHALIAALLQWQWVPAGWDPAALERRIVLQQVHRAF